MSFFRITGERRLRAGTEKVVDEGNGSDRKIRDPEVGDIGVRGVHKGGAKARRHALGGPRRRVRGTAGERGVDKAARERHEGDVLLADVLRGPHVRAGGEAQRVGASGLGASSDTDALR